MRKIVAVEGVGDVVFERSKRAKYINISVSGAGAVRVAIPGRVSFKNAMEFLDTKRGWVKKHLANVEKVERRIPVVKVDKAYAREVIIPRLEYLAEKYGFEYNRVTLRNQKTRWGSCSENNNISLNINLASLPQELMDYVILHELVHTKVKNHRRQFWACLGKFISDPKKHDKRLRDYSIHLG